MAATSVSAAALRGESARFRKPATQKEADILEAATLIFSEKGYEGARTAEIAAAAGVTERTLFRYFASKEKLYRRVTFPALLVAALPRAFTDAGEVFGTQHGESFQDWYRHVLHVRVAAAREAAPQYRFLIGALMTDEALRHKLIGIWRETVLAPLLRTVQSFQERGDLRSDLDPKAVTRALISMNLGYIITRALLAPEADWNDSAEIEATIDLMLRGSGVAASGK